MSRRTIEPALYASPLDLPERRIGKLALEHFTIDGKVYIVGARSALLTGRRPTYAMLNEPRRCHRLFEDGVGVWMTDLPEELNQIAEVIADLSPHGKVCVGGLGLGILSRTLVKLDGVERVVTVEKNETVIELCRCDAIDGGPHKIVNDDIEKFLRGHVSGFDCYLLDTWQATGEAAWWSEVMPLRRAIRRRHGNRPKIWCWAEDIMRGQVQQSLTALHNPANPRTHWYYKGLPRMTGQVFDRFWNGVGLPWWEKAYGVTIDATISEMEADRVDA